MIFKPAFLAVSAILLISQASANRSIASIPPARETEKAIRAEIDQALLRGKPLGELYSRLADEWGGEAVKPLLDITLNERNSDEVRRTSLFGLGRIAGKESIPVIRRFMSHNSWMLRDAALKTAAALDARELSPQIEGRLRDNALVVRTTAVQTIGHLKLRQSAPKLIEALFDPLNYNGQKPLWIHRHILQTLKEFEYKPAVPRLVQLLDKSRDKGLQAQVVQTLEGLTGKSFSGKSLDQQIYLWKRNTISERTF